MSNEIQFGEFEMDEDELTRQFKEATKRGKESMRTEPRAVAVRYDKECKHIVIDLLSGATFSFPKDLVESLSKASDKEIADVEVKPYGFAIEWKTLDEHISVSGLLNGRLGSKRWMKPFYSKWGKFKK